MVCHFSNSFSKDDLNGDLELNDPEGHVKAVTQAELKHHLDQHNMEKGKLADDYKVGNGYSEGDDCPAKKQK